MYVTRPLSWYKKFPAELKKSPSTELGPNSGILVIEDDEDPAPFSSCFGLCRIINSRKRLTQLPIPQNKETKIHRDEVSSEIHYVFFFPVLDQPLSSNRYYVLQSRGKNKGKVFKSSKWEEDIPAGTDCFGDRNGKPQAADHEKFKFYSRRWTVDFSGKSVASESDVIPRLFLGFFRVDTFTTRNSKLGEARGLDIELRARLPEFNFPLSYKTCQPVVVGKWYCPFIFIKDGSPEDQVAKSTYYKMTLEQRWEQVFACDNIGDYNDVVILIDVKVEREVFRVGGNEKEALRYGSVMGDNGVMWFKSCSKEGKEVDIGLSLAIFERMKWEQERVGWSSKEKREERIERAEKFGNEGKIWKKFGCYILVERFVLRRMDGSLAFTYDFKHTHQIRSKWEC
ncbi:hypothetical protein COLO4_27719 [Corchorus olitorius]|uniref:Uncharacterized protein n=1 Tax=Corchorus olitorius TaxID=93759 RepID=A0A1R3HPM1_9ROSI|nr:hypothetical protein COLO4_27719 [Corchorus olitorius]